MMEKQLKWLLHPSPRPGAEAFLPLVVQLSYQMRNSLLDLVERTWDGLFPETDTCTSST
ncbi:hypothetical protein TCAL_15751 [Tigriopus californicus]|uniref:Uncharacterized protein n=1 Tax=Tigriopus californicus TaxID=6832 RepID=A0A553P7N3_TIGCA|nr:hypothetical protein TCAL_15751 [Tigriopus californicus]